MVDGGHGVAEGDVPGVVVPGVPAGAVEPGLDDEPVPEVPGVAPGMVPHGPPDGLLSGFVFGFTVDGFVLLPGVGEAGEFEPGTVDGVVELGLVELGFVEFGFVAPGVVEDPGGVAVPGV